MASLTGRRNWPPPRRGEGRQPVRDAGGFGPRPARGGGGQIRPNSERINCVPHGAIYALGIGPVRGANSDSPSEISLANSGAIRSDGRKNPSAYFALA